MVWYFLVNLHMHSSPFYIAAAQSQYLLAIWRNSGLITMCLSCGFACQPRVLKIFSSHGYSIREWDSMTMIFLVNLHMFSSPIYTATAQCQYLITIGRNGSVITLCLSCSFAGQWRVLKIFPGPGCDMGQYDCGICW